MVNITGALLLILGINAMLFLGQAAIIDVGGMTNVYECSGNILGQFDVNNCQNSSNYALSDSDPFSQLPSGETGLSPETGNIFTDTFTTLKTWIIEKTGLGYIINILSAPSNLLKAMGLPSAFSFVVGAIWYALTLFLIIAWLVGRDA